MFNDGRQVISDDVAVAIMKEENHTSYFSDFSDSEVEGECSVGSEVQFAGWKV